MNKNEKLFRKLSQKKRKQLLNIVQELVGGNTKKTFNIMKIQGTEFYRLRKSKFRIIFHYNQSGKAIIDSVRLRNKNTYKNL